VEDRLLFVIGPPRGGTTLLTRMLGAHSDVHSPPEPHLMTPLAHLGYWERVEQAPYDPIIAQRGIREIVGVLPNGEADYLESLRAYTDTLYRKLIEPTGRRVLLDKTPAYALVLDFLARLYPNARTVVITRNPMAVWSSFVQSFFDGDHESAHRMNPLLERYVPAMARFLRERPMPVHHVRYEELVKDPEAHMKELAAFAGLAYEDAMVNYGEQAEGRAESAKGLGDPITVAKETRPTTKSVARWAEDMAGDAAKVEQAEQILARLDDADLETWGFARAELAEQLAAVPLDAPRTGGRGLSRYTLERKLLVLARRRIQRGGALQKLVRKLREACDVLLR
jgi:hypothetical protein